MRNILLVTCIFYLNLGLLFLSSLNAQELTPEVIGSSGGNTEIGSYNYSWTVGEAVIQSFDNPGAIVLQGFHQPDYYLDVKTPDIVPASIVTIYPNPVASVLNISLAKDGMTYLLECLDISGNYIFSKNIDHDNSQVSVRPLPQGIYIIKIRNHDGKEIFQGMLVKI